MRLGIDFGTTRTVVAAASDGRHPVISFDLGDRWADHIPGIAARVGDELRFGWEAVEAVGQNRSDAVVRSLKRVITERAPDAMVENLNASAEQLLVGFAKHLAGWIQTRSTLEESSSHEALIAVPAAASSRQRYLTLEAFDAAGFRVLGMLNEPTAAAIEYAHQNQTVLSERSPKRYVVVYDLGGGTFDTAAVSLEGRNFGLLATEGIGQLGGHDIDEAILQLAARRWDLRPGDLNDSERHMLLEACREGKEAVRPQSRRLLVEPPQGPPPILVNLSDLEPLIEPFIERTLQKVDELFAQLPSHGVDPDDTRQLGALYLVGGAAAFPLVARRLRQAHGRKIRLCSQPHAATAVGLAVAADAEAGIFVREATTRCLGVWRERGNEKVFDPIVDKGLLPATEGAVVVRRTYQPAHTVGLLRFVECSKVGEDGQPGGDLTPFARVAFPYDPALAQSAPDQLTVRLAPELKTERICETYTYAADGTISVAIENETRGYRKSWVLGQLR